MNDWIEWKGGECPVPADTLVCVRCRDGYESSRPENACNWRWGDVVAYRVVWRSDTHTQDATTNVAQILTERGERYGKFIKHADVTQCLKKVLFNRRIRDSFAPDQVEALEMICHKMARIVNGDPDYADSWIDIAGYAKLVADRLQGVER